MTRLLSPKQLGDAIGVSQSSLKRWIDDGVLEASRTAGGHRRVDLTEAIRFIRERKTPILKPELLGLPGLVQSDATGSHEQAKLLQKALESGDAEKTRAMLASLYVSGISLAELCDGPAAEAMHNIGEIWKHGPEGIFIEHRATDLCAAAINHLRSLAKTPSSSAPVAIGGAPPDDPYMLPSLMAAAVLRDQGWRESNLGANAPWEVLLDAAERSKAKLVWVSISVVAGSKAAFQKSLEETALKLAERGASLAIGGRGCPEQVPHLPHVQHCRSMRDLAAFARGVFAAHHQSLADPS